MIINEKDVLEMISSILKINISLIDDVDRNIDLSQYGMTSISAIQLVVMLEEKYEFEFKDEDLLIDRFNTLNKLFNLLKSY